jgi:opacity protein-like surface antigen
MMLKVRLAVGLVLGCCASPALAQTPPTQWVWDGPHIGLHLGGSSQTADVQTATDRILQLSGVNIIGRGIVIVPETTFVAQRAKESGSTFAGGVVGGWDQRYGQWVGGVVGDINFGGRSTSTGYTTVLAPTALTPVTSVTTFRTTDSGPNLSLRARAGYLVNNMLIYGTGGLAAANLTMSSVGTWVSPGGLAEPDTSPSGVTANLGALGPSVTTVTEESHLQWGWTIGVGGEHPVHPSFSVGVEYRFTQLGTGSFDLLDRQTVLQGALTGNTTTTSTTAFTTPAVLSGSTELKYKDHRFLVRGSWRFSLKR